MRPRIKIAGILNLDPESFSGDGIGNPDAALRHAVALRDAGADLVDVGAVSTRPGYALPDDRTECARLAAVLPLLEREGVPFSVDAFRAPAVALALDAGAAMVNDVFALRGPDVLARVRDASADLVLMATPGASPAALHGALEDPVASAHAFLAERIAVCRVAGIVPERIWIDPGIGFFGPGDASLRLLRALPAFVALHPRVYVGLSRKRFLDAFVVPGGSADVATARRSPGIGAHLAAASLGAGFLRVHDVRETVEALSAFRAILGP
jgi:dihydropteroate synthase